MKRNDFKKIIKIRSQWQFTGDNYKLPSGEPISVYVRKLVESQMNVDSLAILKNGDLSFTKKTIVSIRGRRDRWRHHIGKHPCRVTYL